MLSRCLGYLNAALVIGAASLCGVVGSAPQAQAYRHEPAATEDGLAVETGLDPYFQAGASQLFIAAVGESLRSALPVVVDPKSAYPTVAELPQIAGKTASHQRFRGGATVSEWYAAEYGQMQPSPARTEALIDSVSALAEHPASAVSLLPGDYAIPVELSCVVADSPPFLQARHASLSPIQGQLAPVLMALNTAAMGMNQAIAQDVNDLKLLAIALQAGIPYSELSKGAQRAAKQFIPSYAAQISQGFIAQERLKYEQIAADMPDSDLPSFDEVLTYLASLEPTLKNYPQLQEQVGETKGDYAAIAQKLAALEASTAAPNAEPKYTESLAQVPWSRVSGRVYARLVTSDRCTRYNDVSLPVGSLQMRVFPPAAATEPAAATVPIMGMFGHSQAVGTLPVLGIPILP